MPTLIKKNKTKGILGSILLHVVILISMFYLGLKSQDPPPTEEGISINFGFSEENTKNIQASQKEEINEINEIKNIKNIENNNELITQSIEEAPILEKEEETKKSKNQESKEELIKQEDKPKVNKQALYNGKKNQMNNTKEKTKIEASIGNLDGEKNINNTEGGGIGVNGSAYQLSGRNVAFKVQPEYNVQVEGKVIVIISVDRAGNVINAVTGAKGSTTLNKKLLEKAKIAALKTKFEAKPSAPLKQQGKIVYSFKLN